MGSGGRREDLHESLSPAAGICVAAGCRCYDRADFGCEENQYPQTAQGLYGCLRDMEHQASHRRAQSLAGKSAGETYAAAHQWPAFENPLHDAENGAAADVYFIFQPQGTAGSLRALPHELDAGMVRVAGHADTVQTAHW